MLVFSVFNIFCVEGAKPWLDRKRCATFVQTSLCSRRARSMTRCQCTQACVAALLQSCCHCTQTCACCLCPCYKLARRRANPSWRDSVSPRPDYPTFKPCKFSIWMPGYTGLCSAPFLCLCHQVAWRGQAWWDTQRCNLPMQPCIQVM